MNKNLLFIGAVAVAGYLTLTAFGGKTKAEQMAEIKEKVQMGLDELRTTEKAACDARVAEAVEAKYAEMAAATPEPTPAVAGKPVKKGTKGGPSVKPLPTPPAPPTDPTKTRGGAVKQGTDDVKARGGAVQQGTQDVKKRGGAVKVEGSGN